MTKQEFLMALNDELGILSGEERSSAIKYYSDYIDDAGPENLAAVLQELGSPAKVAASILADAELTGAQAEQKNTGAAQQEGQTAAPPQNKRGGLPVWALVLLVLALAPVWMPVLGICFGAVMTVFGLLVGLFAFTCAMLVAGLVSIAIGLFTMVAAPMGGMFLVAIGCGMAAMGVFSVILCVFGCRTVIPGAARFVTDLFRKLFHKEKGVRA